MSRKSIKELIFRDIGGVKNSLQQQADLDLAIKCDLKADGVERDGIQPVSTTRRNEVISESSATYEIGHRKRIGSSVRPREEWERMMPNEPP